MFSQVNSMPALADLQASFLTALLDGNVAGALPLLAIDGAAPGECAESGERFGIYVDNLLQTMNSSLRLSFPATHRLVGEDYFYQCVRGYVRSHPSTSGDLWHAGAAFPLYLRSLHPAGRYHYLADVAQLEWACQEVLTAADHDALDLARLAEVPAERYENLRFQLHPAVRLFASDYPVLHIWQANVADAAPASAHAAPARRRTRWRLQSP